MLRNPAVDLRNNATQTDFEVDENGRGAREKPKFDIFQGTLDTIRDNLNK